jgi:uncharacterized delta-60 repeat protein
MRFLFSLSCLFVLSLAHAQDGVPDPSFGTSGKVFHSMPGAGTSVEVPNNQRIVVLPNQKILHCFTYNTGAETDFGLVRYNSDGSLDGSFGGDGIITTSIGTNDLALSMVVGANGKIIVGGTSDQNFAVVRYNSDGTLDNTFDTDGIVTTDFGASAIDVINSVNLQSDNKIIAAGYSFNTTTGSSVFAVARYNVNGSLDTGFDTDGRVTTVIATSGVDQINATVMQTDGKIVVAGSSFNGTVKRFALARYNTNGSLDTGFDGDGRLTTTFANDAEAYAVTFQYFSNKIIAAGYRSNGSDNDFAIVRYNLNGAIDNTFDGDGIVINSFGSGVDDIAYSVAMQGDGKIIVAGVTSNNTPDRDFVVTRLETGGSTDAAFGGIGYRMIDFGGDDYGYSIASQGANIIVGGSTGISLALVRLINSSPVLPLQIEAFTAIKQTNSVVLKWQTAYEYNVSHYEVERSVDGNNFIKIAMVNTSGNSQDWRNYEAIDAKPAQPYNYYRLRIVHRNGDVVYSRIIAIQFNSSITKLQAYPNPVKNNVTIQLTSSDKVTQIELVDVSLKVIRSTSITTNGNTAVTSIDMGQLPKGIYFIRVNNEILKLIKE